VIQRSPNQTRGRTPCALSSSGARVGRLLEQRDPRLPPQLAPKKNGELAPIASWNPAIACAAFQCGPNVAGSTS
jgi:hypothetical protein